MGGKNKAPDAPDYSDLADASLESAKIWEQVARDQLTWAQEQGEWGQDILERILGVQLPQMEEAARQARVDRQRYEEVFQPIEDDLIKEFQEFDTEARREAEAAVRVADVRGQFEAQRENALQRLEGYGIDPSQTRSQAMDRGVRAMEAAAAAQAGNQGRKYVEQMGRALRGEAINIGRGMPSQVAQAMGMVNQTAGGAMGNYGAQTGAATGAYGTAAHFGHMGMQGYQQAGNLRNMGFQNSLDSWNADAQQTAGMWGGIGGLAGAAIGGPMGGVLGERLFSPAEEGGHVPNDMQFGATPGPADKYPVILADDEYVIPADVVRKKGTEFFDKLLDRYKDGGDYDTKRTEGES